MASTSKAYGKTRRQWLIEFAAGERQRHNLDGHMALEAIADQASDPSRKGTMLAWAAEAYSNVSPLALERLIAAVERAAPGATPDAIAAIRDAALAAMEAPA